MVNDSILEFADRLGQYGNELAEFIENDENNDIVNYTYETFNRMDSNFLNMSKSLIAAFPGTFDEETDAELYESVVQALDELKQIIIELKYDIMVEFCKVAKKTPANLLNLMQARVNRYFVKRKK